MFRKLLNIIKQHKKISIPVIAALVLSAVGLLVAVNTRDNNNSASLDGWRQWQDWDCKVKSTQNKFSYAMAEYNTEKQAPVLNIVGYVSTKETPEVYIDGILVTPEQGGVDIQAYSNCNGAPHTYYDLQISVPSTCTGRKVQLKNSKYDIQEDISNDSCKTKEQYEAEQKSKADAEAKKKAEVESNKQVEAQRKAQEEADRKANELAANPYTKLGTEKVENYRAYTHYKFNGTAKPSLEQVKQYMVEIQRKGCEGPKTCNFFLWTTQAAYEANKSKVMSSEPSSQTAAKFKDTLVGYVNSGYAFFYYGTTGSAPGRMTIMDPDAGTYVEF